MGRKRVPWHERYRVSRRILGESFRLLAGMRSFWVFPLMSAGVMVVWVLVMVLALSNGFGQDPGGSSGVLGIENMYVATVVLMVLALPLMFVVTLMNSALAYGVYKRIDSEPGGAKVAWRRALGMWPTILRFSLVGLVVGTLVALLGQVVDKFRFIPGLGSVTQIVGALGWAAASFFVFPIIVVEKERRVTHALRRSVGLARDNWGKSVSGIVTISLAVMVPFILVMVPFMLVLTFLPVALHQWFAMDFLTVNNIMEAVFPWVLGVFVVCAVVVAMVNGALQTAYQAGLYRYAVTGDVGPHYSQEALVGAWAPYRGG